MLYKDGKSPYEVWDKLNIHAVELDKRICKSLRKPWHPKRTKIFKDRMVFIIKLKAQAVVARILTYQVNVL